MSSQANCQKVSPISPSVQPDEKNLNSFFVDDASGAQSGDRSIRYIVKLKEPVGVTIDPSHRSSRNTAIREQHKKFKEELLTLLNTDPLGRSASNLIMDHEYVNAYNGFSVRANESTRQKLEMLPDVLEVIEDQVVSATDLASSKIIKADLVWSDLNTTGKNVSIGVVDSGIDYQHADLGGGFGEGFKVKGGYDFVNNDMDPFDDFGHGTHVAGIAAANGPGLKGVAPDADLYAFKVLNNEGSGYDSWILAAIEMALDPDGDPATDDKIDVINMSLGRRLNGEDPLSEAITGAIEQGITFVVSAGNSYDYGTIGTPAVTPGAITVAATDFNDVTASFSSKGPTENTFQIKPDVAAPGVNIYSSMPNNTYSNLNGTSMASPHVAGAVALLLEKHPDWTPEVLKGALMNTAENPNNEMIWHQGAGRINVRTAIESKVVISPGSISFGVSDMFSEITERVQTITLINNDSITRQFSLAADGLLEGLAVTVTPSILKLPPKGKVNVQVVLTVNNSILPAMTYPLPYTGHIKATSGGISIKVPYAFMQTRPTTMEFTGELPSTLFAIRVTQPSSTKTYYPSSNFSVLLPDGTYDLVAFYPPHHYVIKQNVSAGESSLIQFDKSEAKNQVVFTMTDKLDNPLKTEGAGVGASIVTGLNRNFNLYYRYVVDTFYVSNQSSYSFDVRYFGKNPGDSTSYYDITLSSGYGINSAREMRNATDDFTEVVFENPSVEANEQQQLTYWMRASSGLTFWNPDAINVPNPLRVAYTKGKTSSPFLGAIARFSPLEEAGGYVWETPFFSIHEDNSISFSDLLGNKYLTLDETEFLHYKLGSSLPFLNAQMLNSGSKIVLTDHYRTGTFNRYFGEREHGTINYDLKAGEIPIAGGAIMNRLFDTFDASIISAESPPDLYTLKLEYDHYKVHDVFAKVRTTLIFDTRLADKNPPVLSNFYLLSEGASTNTIAPGKAGTVKFNVKNCISRGCYDPATAVPTLTLEIKSTDSTTWNTQLVSKFQEGNYEAKLDTLREGHYDLRLTAKDVANNTLIYELTPAFLVGNPDDIPYKIVRLIEPANGSQTVRVPSFKWTDIPEATEYLIEISATESFDSVFTAASNTALYELNALLEKNTKYFWRVKAKYESTASPWSAVSFFTTGSEDWLKVQLLQPLNLAMTGIKPSFGWTDVNQDNYMLEVSREENFRTIDHQVVVSGTSAEMLLLPGIRYFWRVKPIAELAAWSDVYEFNVATSDLALMEPKDKAIGVDLSPEFRWTPVDAVGSYKVQVYENANQAGEFSDVTNDTTITIRNLYPNTIYHWQVGLVLNDTVVWSTPFSFTTRENKVTLVEPGNRTSNLPLTSTFRWTHTSDERYLIDVSTDSAFSNLHSSLYVSDTSVMLSGFAPGKKYFWRVRPDSERSSWSSTYTFQTVVPYISLVSPENQSLDLPIAIRFEWVPVDEALSYTFTLLSDNNLLNVAAYKEVSTSHLTIDNLNPDATYYWQVGANFSGTTIWSERYTFSTSIVTGIQKADEVELVAYPNPFSGNTFIKFNVRKPSHVLINIVNLQGAEVFREDFGVTMGEKAFLWHATDFDNHQLPEGLYIATIHTGSFAKSMKIVLRR
jgi:hypothetical protein